MGPYPRVEEVILSQTSRGRGTEEDPCRTVIQVHAKDGTFIAENDPLALPTYLRVAVTTEASSSLKLG